jgi:hypothetical protein
MQIIFTDHTATIVVPHVIACGDIFKARDGVSATVWKGGWTPAEQAYAWGILSSRTTKNAWHALIPAVIIQAGM